MASAKDVAGFVGILLISSAVIFATGNVSLPGSASGNVLCDVPVVSDFVGCSTDKGTERRYDLTTTVKASGLSADVSLKDFSYQTEPSGFGLSLLGPGQSLAFGGGNEVEIAFQLYDSDERLVADGSKFLGEVGTLSSKEATFRVNNLEPGNYDVNYRLSFKRDFELTESDTVTKTLEKDIRVPKRIQ